MNLQLLKMYPNCRQATFASIGPNSQKGDQIPL